MSWNDLKKLPFLQDTTEIRILQDAIPSVVPQDSVVSQSVQDSVQTASDSLSTKQLSLDEIQLLFEESNRRQETNRPLFPAIRVIETEPVVLLDSSHVIFSTDSPVFLQIPRFELNLPQYSYRDQETSGPVFIEDTEGMSVKGTRGEEKVLTHKESEKNLVEKEKMVLSNDWILGVLLIAFVILAWIRLFYNKFLSPTFVAVINQQVSHNLFRDKSSVSFRVSSGLNLIFYLNAGLYLYLAVLYLEVDIAGVAGFRALVLMCLLLIALYVAKYIISAMAGVISLTQKTFTEYLHNVSLFNKSLGLALFPVILGIVYMSELLLPLFFYAGIVLIVAAYSLRLFRGFQIFIRESVSIFYWILYLCALEILPILLFFKLSGLLV